MHKYMDIETTCSDTVNTTVSRNGTFQVSLCFPSLVSITFIFPPPTSLYNHPQSGLVGFFLFFVVVVVIVVVVVAVVVVVSPHLVRPSFHPAELAEFQWR